MKQQKTSEDKLILEGIYHIINQWYEKTISEDVKKWKRKVEERIQKLKEKEK